MSVTIRTTEANTLATCEMKWWYRHAKDGENESSPAMTKGTLWHAFWDEWWITPGGARFVDWAKVLGRIPQEQHGNITEQIADDVTWMAKRYDTFLPGGFEATDWRVVDQEVELEVPIRGDVTLQGRLDDVRLHLPTDRLYVGEAKTMADWRRLDILEVDPQLTNYVALARGNGANVTGVFYDAARTYRWKRDEHKHPPSDSFRQMTYLRDEPQVAEGMKEMLNIADRKIDMLTGKRRPVRNISANTCSFCPYRAECYESLSFPEPEVDWSDS